MTIDCLSWRVRLNTAGETAHVKVFGKVTDRIREKPPALSAGG